MTDYREILRQRSLGLSQSKIASSLGVSRTTVVNTLQRASALSLDYPSAGAMSDRELESKLFPAGGGTPSYSMPDYERVYKEMAKPHMTQQLLWLEYCEECRQSGEIPYQLTQFKTYYREYLSKTKATMHIKRKPGETMEVDWAGRGAAIVNDETGEIIDAHVFVAVLPFSGYAYAEAFLNRNQESWIVAHVNAYTFFGGVARMLVPDNLKTGVLKNTKTEVVLNKSYHELAEYYGTVILPTRVRKPKDKPSVESAVGNVSSYILAAIRNHKFFTLQELNTAIRSRLDAFNDKPFQKKDGSRATWFAEESESLIPLPRTPFELAEWRLATVAFNYHIAVDEQYYSVPFEYIKRKVDIRLTRSIVEVFFEGSRVCSHVRLHGRKGQYSTQEHHMPPNHQQYIQWNGERFRSWAAKIGKSVSVVIEVILMGCKVEQQGYRACMALLKLSDKYGAERLEASCSKALEYTTRPNYRIIQTILKSGHDKTKAETSANFTPDAFGFTRGADYYMGGSR